MKETHYCEVCDYPLVYIKHIEFDGEFGSDESYYECINECIKN